MKPVFLPGQAGALFAVYYAPVASSLTEAIIHIPAFAEEMNRSRRMVATQAQAFADQGIACLILDLFGTGDSAGDFSDARWLLWQQDIETARDWLIQAGAQKIGLWGLRLGALLALDHIAHSDWHYETLVLWQLQARGEVALNQFLRLRNSADLLQESSGQATVKSLREALLTGHAVEIAGYCLSPDLAEALRRVDVSQMHLPARLSVLLVEMAAEAGQGLSPQIQAVVVEWQKAGLVIHTLNPVGPLFWITQESSLIPELIEDTTRMVLPLLTTETSGNI